MEYESCFIISSTKQNTAFLRESLRNRGIKFKRVLLDFDINMMDSIRNTIKESDFICCILDQDTDKNQLLELGIAVGLKKPIFLIVDDETQIPFSIKNFVYVKASLDNINAISFNLDQFLKSNAKKEYIDKTKKSNEKKLDDNVINVKDIKSKIYKSNISNKKICNILEELLSNYKDITVSSQKRNMNKGADLALWIDEVEISIGGPILIELKTSSNLNKNLIQKYQNQMKNFLKATKSPAGIILYKGKRNNEITYKIIDNQLPLIILMEIETFINLVINGKLDRFLINKRNEIVHRNGSND